MVSYLRNREWWSSIFNFKANIVRFISESQQFPGSQESVNF
ncbi:hypothetical protein SR187_7820 [Streptococcus ruminantium]|uniref:Uncharacterized protein n=1 Tax=Streptococcus ruminantium TaxID=1917441 RepID=A0A2Z5TQ21_9STRE|nr:hypothetical protein SR187_7820 [Streptococcus ruminantium]